MRRYDVVSGILLILSIIDFALAAPVLVQEKRQACADVVDITKDVIPVLGKRGSGDIERLVKDFFNTKVRWVRPIESSSSALPGPDHGSTSTSSSGSSLQGDPWPHKGNGELYTPESPEYGSDHELTGGACVPERRTVGRLV
jgi:hypothetical protein